MSKTSFFALLLLRCLQINLYVDILGSTPETITSEVQEGLLGLYCLKKSIAAFQSIIDVFFFQSTNIVLIFFMLILYHLMQLKRCR